MKGQADKEELINKLEEEMAKLKKNLLTGAIVADGEATTASDKVDAPLTLKLKEKIGATLKPHETKQLTSKRKSHEVNRDRLLNELAALDAIGNENTRKYIVDYVNELLEESIKNLVEGGSINKQNNVAGLADTIKRGIFSFSSGGTYDHKNAVRNFVDVGNASKFIETTQSSLTVEIGSLLKSAVAKANDGYSESFKKRLSDKLDPIGTALAKTGVLLEYKDDSELKGKIAHLAAGMLMSLAAKGGRYDKANIDISDEVIRGINDAAVELLKKDIYKFSTNEELMGSGKEIGLARADDLFKMQLRQQRESREVPRMPQETRHAGEVRDMIATREKGVTPVEVKREKPAKNVEVAGRTL